MVSVSSFKSGSWIEIKRTTLTDTSAVSQAPSSKIAVLSCLLDLKLAGCVFLDLYGVYPGSSIATWNASSPSRQEVFDAVAVSLEHRGNGSSDR